MTKRTVVLISVGVTLGFVALVYFGWVHRWGAPAEEGPGKPPVIDVTRLDQSIELESARFDGGLWTELDPTSVELIHQLTWKPWGRNLIPEVEVRAFYNDEDIYFLLEWEDDAANTRHATDTFPDAVATGFPLSEEPPGTSLMMGFRIPLDIWEWKANMDADYWGRKKDKETFSSNQQYAYTEEADLSARESKFNSASQNLVAKLPGTLSRKEDSQLSARGNWQDGKWRVIIKRPLTTAHKEKDVQLTESRKYAAFAVWDGDEGDRGSRKSISDWVILRFEGRQKAQASVDQPSAASSRESALAAIDHNHQSSSSLSGLSIIPEASAAQGRSATSDRDHRVINLKAERFRYIPNEITVQKGRKVTIKLESLDVTHGLYLDGYGKEIKASPGKTAQVTFVADKTGRYTFRCSHTCGPFHAYMVGYLTVEPNSRFHVYIGAVAASFLGISAFIVYGRPRRKEEEESEDE